jgi:gamma-glutamylcyclotransferase (GGCT)/AIG2-like uncharacterized protein YtfP
LLKVFVYGTLKPGEINYQGYCVGQVIAEEPAIAYGRLYALPVGYPAMTSEEGLVYGFLLTFFDEQIITVLDRLEDYHPQRKAVENEYNRQEIDVFSLARKSLGKAWVYQMSKEQVQHRCGVLLPDGCW